MQDVTDKWLAARDRLANDVESDVSDSVGGLGMTHLFTDRRLQILDRAAQIGAERYRLSFDCTGRRDDSLAASSRNRPLSVCRSN